MQESEKRTFLTWGPAHGGLLLGHRGAELPGPKDPLHECLGTENLPSCASSVSQHLIPILRPHSLNTLKDGGLGPLCVVFLARGEEEGEVAGRRTGTLNSGESLGTLTVQGMSSQEQARVPLVWGLLRFPPQTVCASLVDQW